ncbi:MAG: hypothetical protein R3B09_19650 [Nannocystaceae bacterium]
MRRALSTLLLATTALALTQGCSSEPAKPLAEKAEKLEAEKPKSIEARTFKIESAGSSVGFEMEAPLEKIRGRIPEGAISGEINVDFMDLTKSNGLVHVDIKELELFQRKAGDDGNLGEETKSDLQNEHARNWLEIGEDAPEEDRGKNTRVEYSVKTVKSASVTDLTKVTGPERKVTLQVEGEFLLHQRKATKAAELELVFHFDGDKPTKMAVKTVKPLGIGLEEYDVRPREAFGKLAAKTLGALSDKVAQQADLSVEFVAVPDPNQAPAPAPAGDAAAKDEKKEAAPAY